MPASASFPCSSAPPSTSMTTESARHRGPRSRPRTRASLPSVPSASHLLWCSSWSPPAVYPRSTPRLHLPASLRAWTRGSSSSRPGAAPRCRHELRDVANVRVVVSNPIVLDQASTSRPYLLPPSSIDLSTPSLSHQLRLQLVLFVDPALFQRKPVMHFILDLPGPRRPAHRRSSRELVRHRLLVSRLRHGRRQASAPHALVPAGLLPGRRPRRLFSGRTILILGEPATPFHPFPVAILHRCCNAHARGRLLFWALLLMPQLVFFTLFSFVRLQYRPEAVQVTARLHLQHLHSSRLISRRCFQFAWEPFQNQHQQAV
nr:uncharacterized protein LOC127343910 isoform X3 [Lolium perenne]